MLALTTRAHPARKLRLSVGLLGADCAILPEKVANVVQSFKIELPTPHVMS